MARNTKKLLTCLLVFSFQSLGCISYQQICDAKVQRKLVENQRKTSLPIKDDHVAFGF